MGDDVKWFLDWERASQDTIDVKRCYIDVAGDLVSGVLLSQIVYWFLPGGDGTKLQIERDGEVWLAKGRSDWWAECRISEKQFDRAVTILREQGLVKIRLFHFHGHPTVHLALCLDVLVERVKSILTKGENTNPPKGEIQLDQRGKSLHTEITPKTTTENIGVLPDWINREPWEAFLEMRKVKKKPLTGRAKAMIIKKLDELRQNGNDPGDVLDQSTLHCWIDVFELKNGGNGIGQANGVNRGHTQEKTAAQLRAGLDGPVRDKHTAAELRASVDR